MYCCEAKLASVLVHEDEDVLSVSIRQINYSVTQESDKLFQENNCNFLCCSQAKRVSSDRDKQ